MASPLSYPRGLVKLNNRSGKSGGDSRLDTQTISAQDATHPGSQNLNLTKPFRVLEGFPDLAHDDEVDACSGALEMLNPNMKGWGAYELARRQAEQLQAEREATSGARPTHLGPRLHGMARRAEEIELNRGRS